MPGKTRFPRVKQARQASTRRGYGREKMPVINDNFDPSKEPNPFVLPDEDIFLLRERDKLARRAEIEAQQQLKIWARPTKGNTVVDRVPLLKQGNHDHLLAQPVQDRMFQGRRREKENLGEFIAKKRDMFLIQMSIDTKKQEIQKLDEKAKLKEDALTASEVLLEEDAMRFDAFLKENDRKAHDALKRSDQETKEKQAKHLKIKQLQQKLAKVENEKIKFEEQLKNCKKYKHFLDVLTPPHFKERLEKQQEQRRLAREKRLQEIEKQRARGVDVTELLDEESKADESVDDMYFKDPEMLLQIFNHLEERNLFLIQNVQEMEETLEELKQQYTETEEVMKRRTSDLSRDIAGIQSKIRQETERRINFAKRNRVSGNTTAQSVILKDLEAKVKQVYKHVGFNPEQQTDTLEMLREVEGWLEYLLTEIKCMDPDQVAEAEKANEVDRRWRARIQRKAEEKRLAEERMEKSKLRAEAEIFKKSGKIVMYRSPPRRKRAIKQNQVNEEEERQKAMIASFFTI